MVGETMVATNPQPRVRAMAAEATEDDQEMAARMAERHLERWTDGITTFLLAGGLGLFALLLVTLPNAVTATGAVTSLGWFLPAVVLAGALGAWIHAAQSFAGFVGTRRFTARWGRWYLLRPMIGGFLAFLVFVLGQAGLVPGLGNDRAFLFLGVATLVGLFSRPLVDKVLDVVEAMLDSGRNRRRALDRDGDGEAAP